AGGAGNRGTGGSQGFSLGSQSGQLQAMAQMQTMAQMQAMGQSQQGQPNGLNPSSDQSASSGSQPIVGGPIVGVISTSKEKSIRSFGGKDHYNQWQFIYDPGMETK